MMKAHRSAILVGMSAAALLLLSGASFSRAGRNKSEPVLFHELLAVGDHVAISYIGETIQLTIVTSDDFWRRVGGLQLPVQRGVVTGTFPDYVQIRLDPDARTLALAGTAVVVHFPYRAIDAINVHVRD